MTLETRIDEISEEDAVEVASEILKKDEKNAYDCSTCSNLIEYYIHDAVTKRGESVKEALQSFVGNVEDTIIPTLKEILGEISAAVNKKRSKKANCK